MRSEVPSALPRGPLRLQVALYPSVHANQQIQVATMTGVLWSVHPFMRIYNGPNYSAVVCSISFTTSGAIWAA